MATQDDQKTIERNDPAIDPDTPDNHMGQDKAPPSTQGGQDGSQSQADSGAQGQGNTEGQSAGNSYTPDFEPEEQTSPDTTGEQADTGETDRDIDTAGG